MRNALVEQLCLLARDDARIFLLTADLGWSVVEAFAREFPERFLNVGVAEQNMAGIATGLAMVGYRPFIYSIANFATLRCYEQIRNGPVLHRLPVCVVGIGGGYAYGPAGPTHHAVEDLGALRALPGMRVVAPADPAQTQTVLSAALEQEDPVYLRVGKGGNVPVPGLQGRFEWNAPTIIRRGGDEVLLLATGAMAVEACAAADILLTHGITASVGVMAHLPPDHTPELVECLSGFSTVLTAEEGTLTGGLSSLVGQAIAREGLGCRLIAAGVSGRLAGPVGSRSYMLGRQGLDPASLATMVLAHGVQSPARAA